MGPPKLPRPPARPVQLLNLGPPARGQGLQRWIYASLREAIIGTRLPAGSRLPGTRSLALQYGLARGTVKAAYDQLLSEGYLLARRGSGTRRRRTTRCSLSRNRDEPITQAKARARNEVQTSLWFVVSKDSGYGGSLPTGSWREAPVTLRGASMRCECFPHRTTVNIDSLLGPFQR